MKRFHLNLAAIMIATIIFSKCGSHDPELENPDKSGGIFSHGYNLTALGCLVQAPWEYELGYGGLYNTKVFLNGQELYSKGYHYTGSQTDLVFKLQKDRSLLYWLKKDYLVSPTDTTSDGEIRKKKIEIDTKNIKQIFKGSWRTDFTDSTIQLNFTDVKLPLEPITGKYIHLGVGMMDLQQSFFFDSILNGSNKQLKKVITMHLIQ